MLYSILPKSQVKIRVLKQLAAAVSASLALSAITSLKPSPVLAARNIPPANQTSTQLAAQPDSSLQLGQVRTTVPGQSRRLDHGCCLSVAIRASLMLLVLPLFFGGL